MNAAVILTVLLGQLAWAWIGPHVVPRQQPLPVVIVSTDRIQEVASNGH